MNDSVDWHLLQSFAALATHGSLSKAARETGRSQPTLSRHLAQLEARQGTRLAERGASGLRLTEAGAALAADVAQMATAAARLSAASDRTTTGSVRLTASRMAAAWLLPPILADLRSRHPGIALEVVASDAVTDLMRRDADIALRMVRPDQPDLIARKLGDVPIAAFAAPAYLDRKGRPARVGDLSDHDIVGDDRGRTVIDGARAAGHVLTRDDLAVRCDDQVIAWQMVRAGAGIGFAPRALGAADPAVEEVTALGTLAVMPVWLAAHRALRDEPRIRFVFDTVVRHWPEGAFQMRAGRL